MVNHYSTVSPDRLHSDGEAILRPLRLTEEESRDLVAFLESLQDAGNGYRGRMGIYELVLVDDHLRTMIHDGAAEHDLERHARTLTPSIRDDGRAKILRGDTTVEEVLRVTRED